ncbi:MAG: SAM-dependent methyltransferase [Actinomadura sp.]
MDHANVARVYDYLLGGKDHYEADRAAGEKMKQVNPGAVAFVRENRRFMQRAAHYVAHQGVKRFIDLGTGLPTAGPLHEVHLDARTRYIEPGVVPLPQWPDGGTSIGSGWALGIVARRP